ncbi:hypothetical protein AGR1C_pAt40142 [Agrobacterium fabacearum TT111]|nr:hypothetical protein AGR1C_pAt40142 [Agrobacterium fabacearum TT111]
MRHHLDRGVNRRYCSISVVISHPCNQPLRCRRRSQRPSGQFRGHLSGTLAIVAKKLHLRNTPALYRWLIGFTRLLRVRVFDYS